MTSGKDMGEPAQRNQPTPRDGGRGRIRRTSVRAVFVFGTIIAALGAWGLLGNETRGHLVWISGMVVVDNDRTWAEGPSAALAVEEEPGTIVYYDIVEDGKGRELLGHADKFVAVNGNIGQDEDGRRWVRVKTWHFLPMEGDDVPPEPAKLPRDMG